MPSRYSEGRFVHVVGLVDLDQGTGDISYVGPTGRGILREGAGNPRIELEVQDGAGGTLHVQTAELRRSSCAPPDVQNGMIQEHLPFIEGMSKVLLKLDGNVVDTYEAGTPPAAAALGLQPEAAGRMGVRAAAPLATERGVTYTVQVQPEGQAGWQTIAVGRRTPDAEVDVKQFPGARKLQVRVLQTDGFTSDEVMRREVVLGDER